MLRISTTTTTSASNFSISCHLCVCLCVCVCVWVLIAELSFKTDYSLNDALKHTHTPTRTRTRTLTPIPWPVVLASVILAAKEPGLSQDDSTGEQPTANSQRQMP